MPELLIITALFVVVAAAMWLFVAGDREQDFTDEEDGFR